jgi:hypothetical protein
MTDEKYLTISYGFGTSNHVKMVQRVEAFSHFVSSKQIVDKPLTESVGYCPVCGNKYPQTKIHNTHLPWIMGQ